MMTFAEVANKGFDVFPELCNEIVVWQFWYNLGTSVAFAVSAAVCATASAIYRKRSKAATYRDDENDYKSASIVFGGISLVLSVIALVAVFCTARVVLAPNLIIAKELANLLSLNN